MTINPDADAPTAAELAAYLGAAGSSADVLGQLRETAIVDVQTYLGAAGVASISSAVWRQAITEVTAELWNRRKAPNGIATFGDLEAGAVPLRIRADAVNAVAPMLHRVMGGGFA